jgi:hypothetical protein
MKEIFHKEYIQLFEADLLREGQCFDCGLLGYDTM